MGSHLKDKFLNHVSWCFFHLVIFLALVLMLTRINCVSSLILANSWTGFGHFPIVVGNVRLKSWKWNAERKSKLPIIKPADFPFQAQSQNSNNCWSLKLKSDCKLVLPRSLFPTFIEAIKQGKYFDLPFSKLNAKFNLQWRKKTTFLFLSNLNIFFRKGSNDTINMASFWIIWAVKVMNLKEEVWCSTPQPWSPLRFSLMSSVVGRPSLPL